MIDLARPFPGEQLTRYVDGWLTPLHLRWVIVILALASTAYFQFTFPIRFMDSDMWYHLSDGRYTWEHGEPPLEFYYSFVDWDLRAENHFWLFQAIIYRIYEMFDYAGLLVTRAAFSITASAAVVALIYSGQKFRSSWSVETILALLCISALIIVSSRMLQLRPHTMSILMIALTLIVFQRGRNLWTLPLIGVAWANLHGVEWIIAGLIAGSYCVEALIRWRVSGDGFPRSMLLWSGIAAAALWLNPMGGHLYLQPFAITGDFSLFVLEMSPTGINSLVSPYLPKMALSELSALFIFALAISASIAFLVVKRQLRVSHALMVLGGCVLIFKGQRFLSEWCLLSLPLIKHAVRLASPSLVDRNTSIPIRLLLITWLVYATVMMTPSTRLSSEKLPFDRTGLPIGSVQFLQQHGGSGKLFASPNRGGYLALELSPGIKIFSDMKFPPEATYQSIKIRRHQHVFDRFIEQYRPEFLAADLVDPRIVAFLGEDSPYKPVFFDDIYVLYADLEQRPDLAGREMKHIDPLKIQLKAEDEAADIDDDDTEQPTSAEKLSELRRVAADDPYGVRVREFLWSEAFDDRRFEEALVFGQEVARAHPGNPIAAYMQGEAYAALHDCAQAEHFHMQAIEQLTVESQRRVWAHLGECYYQVKEFEPAYRNFSKGINPYKDEIESFVLYHYAFTAAIIGSTQEALRILDKFDFIVDEADDDLMDLSRDLRRTLTSPTD